MPLHCFISLRWIWLFALTALLNYPNATAEENAGLLEPCRLFQDLLIVDYWNRRASERFPVAYNHLLQGGYFSMPSARMGCEGEVGFGYAQLPPYRHWNIRCQLTPFLELTGNYRVFRGVTDIALTRFGFGDFSDKGANFKLALFSPEDSSYQLPGFAFGMEDVLGTRAFKNFYFILTQVFPDYNIEASLGWGHERIRGFFGAAAWYPFRRSRCSLFSDLSLVIEYDAIPYHSRHIEKHPKGRIKKTAINGGLKWRLWDHWDFSASYIRGNALAFSASTFFNPGETVGLLPKKDDPLPYCGPTIVEPLGQLRSEQRVACDLLLELRRQQFDVLHVYLGYDNCDVKALRIHIANDTYRSEQQVKERLDALLARLIPNNIDAVSIVIEGEGFAIHEYRYNMAFVRKYAQKQMGSYELGLLSPMREVDLSADGEMATIFCQALPRFSAAFYPKTETFFGSSRGKFKYALGVTAAFEGYLFYDLFWSLQLGWLPFANLYSLKDVDRINPSQLINVRTDVIRYYQNKEVTLDEAYLQKSWNLGKGWFSRCSAGYFEMAYGGIAGQLLYYPVGSRWAFGLEGAAVKKRRYRGIAFATKIRKLKHTRPTYQHFFGSQFFADAYYHLKEANLDLKMQTGKFLARDWGVRWELIRYFKSGLEVTLWYTLTNGHDTVNGKRYFDKGIAFSMPIDMFYTRSLKERWGYGLSAWLRDVGAQAATGRDLYEAIRSERMN